ncbi:ribonuclease H-like domain-containing protein [Tanacetum coccineum]
MDLETAQNNVVAKLPLLKQGDYEMWRLRIDQYFQIQDYALWDIIENGNSFNPVARTTTNADGTSTSTIPGPVTTEEKAQKKNDVKARNLDSMSFDDLYNNFKIVEQEVKRTVTSSSNSGSQNMAFVSTPSSTNEINTANVQVSNANSTISTDSTLDSTANLSDATVYAFLSNQPNGSQLVHEDLEQIYEDNLEETDFKWQLALLSIRARRYYQRTRKKITINGSDIAGYDKSKVECFNCHKIGHITRECRGPMNKENRLRNQDSSRRTVNVEDTSSKAMVAIDGAGFDWSYMADEEVHTNLALMAFSDSEEFQQPKFKGYGFKDHKSVCENSSNEIMKTIDALIIKDWVSNCDEDDSEVMGTGQREVRPVWNNAMRVNHQKISNSRRNFVPTAVLTKSGIVPVSAARPINIAAPKSFVNVAKTRPNAFQKSHSLSRRPFYQQTTLKNRNLNDKVNTAKVESVNTAKGKRVTSVIEKQGINAVKSSACWAWRPKIKILDHVSKNSGSYIYLELKVLVFWQTVTIDTVNDGEQQLTVTVDGQTIAITEASLTLMGYVSNDDKLNFQKAKILADASKEKVKTYTRRRSTDSLRDSTAGGPFSTAEELQKQLDEREETDNIDWNTVAEQVQERQSDTIKRYQTLKKKPVSVAQARKNIMIYLKNMAGYKMGYFKGMSYDKIRPIFKEEYNKIQNLFKKDTEVEKAKTNRITEETLLQESFKKLRTAEASRSEPIQEQPTEELKELSEEELKKMIDIVPVEEIKAEVLQVKYPITD